MLENKIVFDGENFCSKIKNDLLRDNHKKKIKKILDKILKENDPIIQSLSKN